jgi:hypothetical protein
MITRLTLLLSLVALFTHNTFAANPPEDNSLASRFGAPEGVPTYQATVYVDASAGSDLNSGDEASPVKSLASGLWIAKTRLDAGQNTEVRIKPGVYRETVALPWTSTSASLSVKAVTAGTVVISGADSWTGNWQRSTSNTALFTRAWPYRWAMCAIPVTWRDHVHIPQIVRRREIVAIGGVLLTQVLKADHLKPGTFRVDESKGVLTIWPPSGVDPNTASVEVGVRPELLSAQGLSNVIVSGLTFRHANSCYAGKLSSAVFACQLRNSRFENVTVEENNGVGFSTCFLDGFTGRNLRANANGGNGLTTYQSKNVFWDDVEVRLNNRRTAQGAFYGWDSGGAKLVEGHQMGFRNFRAYLNLSRGIWFDHDNRNVEVEGMDVSDNVRGGLWSEGNPGPLAIRGSQFCRNNYLVEVGKAGVEISNSHGFSLTNSLLYRNGGSQLSIGGGMDTGRPVVNWETHETDILFWRDMTFQDNTVVAGGSELVSRVYTGDDWSGFVASLQFDRNRYWNPDRPLPFEVKAYNALYDLPGWQGLTGADASSSFSAPPVGTGGSCGPRSVAADFMPVVTDASWKSVVRGGSTTYPIKLFPVGGYSGTAKVSLHTASSFGASLGLSASTLSASGQLTVQVSTSGTTKTGEFALTVIANDGSRSRTVTVLLKIE